MDRVNSTLVAAIILTFSALLFLALPDVQPSLLLESQHWEAVPDTIPVIALAYVYHNVVPVIATSLEGDRRKVRLAIVAGSLVPMAMFLLWDAAALGTPGALKGGVGGGVDVVAALQQSSEAAGAFVGSFSFLALTTSFIGFVFGLSDFLAGAMGMPSGRPRAVPFALTLVSGARLIYSRSL